MKLGYLISSDSAAVSPDGKLMLSGIFRRIFAQTAPAQHGSMAVAFELSEVPLQQVPLLVRVTLSPSAKKSEPIAKNEMTMNVGPEHDGGVAGLMLFNGVIFPSFGDYRLDIEVNGKNLGTRELVVKHLP